jgi:hypothetical protein
LKGGLAKEEENDKATSMDQNEEDISSTQPAHVDEANSRPQIAQ